MGEIKRRHALCLMGVFCLPLPAASAHRTDSIRNLGEVVVKAKTYKEVIPAQTLKGEELRKLNSFPWLMPSVIFRDCKSKTTAVWPD